MRGKNDQEIGIEWLQLIREYRGTASTEEYTLIDRTRLSLFDKDQKWFVLKIHLSSKIVETD